ncbi:MAG: hypothetical protein MZV64_15860 [Ignavibacteriales bacterium]|nr:hypothetical protein [Ignavibacteriales bacterium]
MNRPPLNRCRSPQYRRQSSSRQCCRRREPRNPSAAGRRCAADAEGTACRRLRRHARCWHSCRDR